MKTLIGSFILLFPSERIRQAFSRWNVRNRRHVRKPGPPHGARRWILCAAGNTTEILSGRETKGQMKKDKYGIYLGFYTALGFIFALLGYTELTVFLLGFVIVVHKDRWAVMQVMQALFLSLFNDLTKAVGAVFHGAYELPFMGEAVAVYWDALYVILYVFFVVLAIAGIIRTARGEDAGLVLFKRFAEKAFGLVRVVTYHEASSESREEKESSEGTDLQG